MKYLTKFGILLLSGIFIISATLSAEQPTAPSLKTNTLKTIMQGLLADTKNITEGIFTDNFKMIEKAANNIAKHPQVPLTTRMQLKKAFGKKMQQFKAHDIKVHQAAVAISKAAHQNEMKVITTKFHELLKGCESCHGQFKKAVQKL